MTSTPPDQLVAAAWDAHVNSYCPYSGYHVGAAIRTGSGRIVTCCNVENAAFPLSTCAEAGAISVMVHGGDDTIAEIVVVTDGDVPGTPCGGCRQRIREFAAPDVLIHSIAASGATLTRTMAELLPDSFGPEFLATSPSEEVE